MSARITEPVWRPDVRAADHSALRQFFRAVASSRTPDPGAAYADWHAWSTSESRKFWTAAFNHLNVVHEADAIGTDAGPRADGPMRQPGTPGASDPWFPGVRLNFAENLLAGPADAPAIIAHAEGGQRMELSFSDLREAAARCAQALIRAGVGPGDVVAGFLPNVPEGVVAMLGAAWIGATWTSCSPDFGVKGVLDRFGQVKPKVLVCADGYRYGGKVIDSRPRAREIAAAIPSLVTVVMIPFLGGALPAADPVPGAVRWSDWLGGPEPAPSGATDSDRRGVSGASPPFARLPFEHPLYIMYSSGTTGLPKCMVHGAGGTLLQHRKEHRLHCDIAPGDRVFYFTTCGWMMWNWLVSALASGATIVLYDGAPMPPDDPGVLWRVAEREGVTVFGTSAKYLAACEVAGLAPAADRDLGPLRLILSTGSPLAPHGFDFVGRQVKPGVHLASISGGTDLISCFVLGNPLLPVYRGEIQCAGLGMAVDIFDADGRPLASGAGELVCTRPFPSMPTKFWNDPDGTKYRDAYFTRFPGAWRHGDWVERTVHGGYIVHGRSDATLNPGGVRIGTAEIYREAEQVPGVVECVAVGQDVPDGTGGTDVRVVLFVRLADGLSLDVALKDRIRRRIREHASPHHVPRVIVQVPDIPRTISGKITELAIRDVIHGRPVSNKDAMANPGALEHFRDRAELRVG